MLMTLKWCHAFSCDKMSCEETWHGAFHVLSNYISDSVHQHHRSWKYRVHGPSFVPQKVDHIKGLIFSFPSHIVVNLAYCAMSSTILYAVTVPSKISPNFSWCAFLTYFRQYFYFRKIWHQQPAQCYPTKVLGPGRDYYHENRSDILW